MGSLSSVKWRGLNWLTPKALSALRLNRSWMNEQSLSICTSAFSALSTSLYLIWLLRSSTGSWDPATVILKCNKSLLRVHIAPSMYQTLERSEVVNQRLIPSKNSLRVVGNEGREGLVP